MTSAAIATAIKILETLPDTAQSQAVEHLREYVAELQDKARWDELFMRTQDQLVAAARRAKQEIKANKKHPPA